jgi:hypothetical protein
MSNCDFKYMDIAISGSGSLVNTAGFAPQQLDRAGVMQMVRAAYLPVEGWKSFGWNGLQRVSRLICQGGPQPPPTRRDELAQRAAVVQELQQYQAQGELVRGLVAVPESVSTGASLLGVGAVVTRTILATAQILCASRVLSQIVQPALGAVSGTAYSIACIAALRKLTVLSRQAKAGLQEIGCNGERVREAFYGIVGKTPEQRHAALKTLSLVLSQSEAENLMVIAKRVDQASRLNTPGSIEAAAIGLALVQIAARKHMISRVLMLLVSLASIALSIALLVNPFSAPLAWATLALGVLSLALMAQRAITDRSFCLHALRLPAIDPAAQTSALAKRRRFRVQPLEPVLIDSNLSPRRA